MSEEKEGMDNLIALNKTFSVGCSLLEKQAEESQKEINDFVEALPYTQHPPKEAASCVNKNGPSGTTYETIAWSKAGICFCEEGELKMTFGSVNTAKNMFKSALSEYLSDKCGAIYWRELPNINIEELNFESLWFKIFWRARLWAKKKG